MAQLPQYGVGTLADIARLEGEMTLEQRLPEPGAEEPAVGLGEHRLRDLEGAPDGVVDLGIEGVQPGIDAPLHVTHRLGEEPDGSKQLGFYRHPGRLYEPLRSW